MSFMRKSELVPDLNGSEPTTGLLWSQIDFKGRVIHLINTKTGIPRDIPITDELVVILRSIPRTLGDDRVFTYKGKSCINARNGLRKACEEANILYGKKLEGGFVFGDRRGTAKTLMARAGADKAYRDAILGHESQDMDRHYLHPDFEKDLRTAMVKYHTWLKGQIASVTQNVTQRQNENFFQ